MCEAEKVGAHFFGKALYATDDCTACGWCARQCPGGNIRMADKIPEFGGKCVMCFRCVYGCPAGAIQARFLSSLLNKQGFDMKRYDTLDVAEDKKVKSVAWVGVIRYLDSGGKSI